MKNTDPRFSPRAHDLIRNYLLPPRCPGCRRLLPLKMKYATPFCTDCREEFESELLRPCPTCDRAMCECGCLPPLLTENGITEGLLLSAYIKDGRTATNRIVYFMKNTYHEGLFSDIADRLAHRVRRFLKREGLTAERIAVASLPRRRSAKRAHGFDQAEALAVLLAKRLGCTYTDCIRRRGIGKEQKALTAKERMQNASGAFCARKGTDLSGYTVFLVDDIVTTGSGLYECAEVLLSCGAVRVVPTVIARTMERRYKRT